MRHTAIRPLLRPLHLGLFACVLGPVALSTACWAAPAPLQVAPGALPASGAFVLVGAGDIGDCSDQSARSAEIVKAVLAASANAWAFTAGDNAYNNGSPDDFARCYAPTWGAFRERTLPVAGNHDWRTPGAAGFRAYFGIPDGQPTWRAVDVGTWRVFLLDSDCRDVGGCGPESPQGQWLAAELKKRPTGCSLAIFHHARFSSGTQHNNDPRAAPLWQALDDAGTELVISGHEHSYERFVPLTASGAKGDGKPGHGMPSFVVGTGGARYYPQGELSTGSSKGFTNTSGVLVLHLEATRARALFVDNDGNVRDDSVVTCR